MSLLVLDLDNTVWDKRRLDDAAYKAVSSRNFGRNISMLKDPLTEKPDDFYANHSNHEIWRYKLDQIIESGELFYEGTKILSVDELDINDLVSSLGTEGTHILRESPDKEDLMTPYLRPEEVPQIGLPTGVASSSSGTLARRLLTETGLYEAGIDKNLCAFAEDGKTKVELIAKVVDRYFSANGRTTFAYVGDATTDMQATKEVAKDLGVAGIAIGVLTGVNNKKTLKNAGADYVVNSLDDPTALDFIKSTLNKHAR